VVGAAHTTGPLEARRDPPARLSNVASPSVKESPPIDNYSSVSHSTDLELIQCWCFVVVPIARTPFHNQNAFKMGKWQLTLGAIVLAAWLLAATGRAADEPATAPESINRRGKSRAVFGYDTGPEFVEYEPRYWELRRKFSADLEELQLELAKQTRAGRATPCSRQIFLEVRWLTHYSAHFDRIERRMNDLRGMLARPADPEDAREQVAADGSYDHCSEAWFLKLDATVEELEDRAARGESPQYPLRLLDRIGTPEKLRDYLDSLLISEIRKTGVDNRYELNIGISAIIRLVTGDLGDVYPFSEGMQQALFDYMDNHWQDPLTGFYGGWYRLADGQIRKTADLSVTFHIVSYRRDSTLRLPEMMRTLLAMEKYEFPFGWEQEWGPSNHHNYDVVRLFRVGWPAMDGQQRGQARQAMRRMLEFCLNETLNDDGSFKLMDEDTVGSSFMIPVHLLDDLGYFRRSRRFWTDEKFSDGPATARRIANRIEALGLTDTESRKALRRLHWVAWEDRLIAGAWISGGLGLVLVAGCIWRRRRGRHASGRTNHGQMQSI
jgi:hypothetical protein